MLAIKLPKTDARVFKAEELVVPEIVASFVFILVL